MNTLLEYLERDAYGKKLTAPFWVTRAMGVISIARLPQASVTAKLLDVMEKDKHEVVRLLAWQAILARADELDARTFQRWNNATLAMAEKDAFKGALRIPLLDVLAVSPPSVRSRKIWTQIFNDTNAWEPQDIPVLHALSRTLSAWKSVTLVEALIKNLGDSNACVRAEYVLHNAGCTSQMARDNLKPEIFDPLLPNRVHPSSTELWRKVQSDASAWLTKSRGEWKETSMLSGEPWKRLPPFYIASPVPLDQIDPADKLWQADLELGRADLDQIEAVFVVDATGSMGEVIDWLRRDVARVMSSFAQLCKEPPSVGVVFYRDQGDAFVTRSLPMTSRIQDLAPGLLQMTADGGGDIPEAVLDALRAGVEGMKWSRSKKKSGKVLILVGDAPPKPGTEQQCQAVVKKGAEAGIKTYACKITTAEGKNDLSSFDGIAAAGGGSTVSAEFSPISAVRFFGLGKKLVPIQTVPRPEAQLLVAPAADQPPGERILTHVLSDLINPQYKDRVTPLAQTLLATVTTKGEPEKRLSFPANTPPVGQTTPELQKK